MSELMTLRELYATPGVLNQVPSDEIKAALDRHFSGDWGEVCDEDRESNDAAAYFGDRILSVYRSKAGVKFWIISEHGHFVTTVLLPDEY